MTDSIPVQLAVEDALSEAVLLRIIKSSRRPFAVGACYSRGGCGYLRKTIKGFNLAAQFTPFFVLADLDRAPCAPGLILDWLKFPRHNNLVFRVAVREVEAWLLADTEAISKFLRVRKSLIPAAPESLPDPKKTLIRIAGQSRLRQIREDLVPPAGSMRDHGPNYNGRLTEFVDSKWSPHQAARSSQSLSRAIAAIQAFQPLWPTPRPEQRARHD